MKNSNRALKVLQSVQTLDGKESKSLQIDVVWGKKYEYIEHVLKKKKTGTKYNKSNWTENSSSKNTPTKTQHMFLMSVSAHLDSSLP